MAGGGKGGGDGARHCQRQCVKQGHSFKGLGSSMAAW